MFWAVRLWISLSALFVGVGWILSALHQLNRIGYGVVCGLVAAGLFFCRQKILWPKPEKILCLAYKLTHRFKRPAPFLFMILAGLAFISGLLYSPYNSDTYAYRLPRVLHWLGQGQWHWIHTADMRMNVAGCGYEWLVAPILIFTRTDACLFLINWMSYLLLPGLIFCFLTLAGLRRRVAWWWAWLLATGWCYVTQSASVSNDAMSAVYALAAVVLAMKATETRNYLDLWLSMLAVGLLTGLKQTGIPLFALWLIVVWPARQMMVSRLKLFFLVTSLALLVSGVPTIIFNILHTGSWSGLVALQSDYRKWNLQLDSPFWGIVGNAFCISVQQLLPPFFPWSNQWNQAMGVFLTTPFGAHFRSFESFGLLSSGISESSAGIGLTITLFLLISVFAARKYQITSRLKETRLQVVLRLFPWLLLLFFMAKVGGAQSARFLAGYYVFLFPSVLARAGHEKLVRQGWWQQAVLLSMTCSILLLVLNTTRPLFPAVTLIQNLAGVYPNSKIIATVKDAYGVSRSFQEIRLQINGKIPSSELRVGYACIRNAHLEPALWLPLSGRQVERVLKTDTADQLIRRGIRYVIIENLPSMDCQKIEEWQAQYHASLISEMTFQDRGHDDFLSHVYVMRLNNQ